MKKILLVSIALALASPAWSAQQAITQITGTIPSVGALKTATNSRLAAAQSNFTEIYELLDGAPWLTGSSAPSITNVFWIDTSGDGPVLKYYDGDSWEALSFGGDGSYTWPTASATVKGGIKVGARLSIDGDGVLSADAQTGEGSMVYPGAGIPVSTGSAWGTSLSATSPVFNALSLGVASTTTGIQYFYGNTKAFPFSIFSQGADAPSVGWRLPSTVPSVTSLPTIDSNGYWAYLDPATFAPALGTDDNYATDAEKVKLGNLSGTNTGDQNLSGYALKGTAQTFTAEQTFSAGIVASSYGTSAADGERRSILPSNTTISCSGSGVIEIYNEGGEIKACENDTEYSVLLSRDIGSIVHAYDADLAAKKLIGMSYPTGGSATTATGNINIDGLSADHYYFQNGSTAATYTPVITSPPASGHERYIILTVGGGSGVDTMTWTNVSWIGTAGAAATTASKYSHYGCIIPSSGNAKCKIIAEGADN